MSSSVTSPTIASARPYMANECGAVPSAAGLLGVTAKEFGAGPVRQTLFTFSSAVLTQTYQSSSIAWSATKIYVFPKCSTFQLCATMSMTYLSSAGAAISDANMIHSVGTVTTSLSNAALTTTEADWIPSTTAANGVGVGACTTALTAAQLIWDGNTTAKELFLNIQTSSDITATRTILATGWILATWINCGYTAAS